MGKQRPLILIVDDVKTNVEFVADILSSYEEIESIGVTSSEETLSVAIENKPDLILLDISMPTMDGYQVCKQLKENTLTADIPVIFLTSRVLKDDIVKGFEVGAVDYIPKPFNLSEMLARVKTQLELRHKKLELLEINQHLEQIVEERTQQLKDLNRTLSEANEKLNKANIELSTLDCAKNEFIAHINHELRTPLNGLVGYASLLEETEMDIESKSYLKAVNSLIARLIQVSEISLLFTELQTIDNKIKLSEVSISEFIPLFKEFFSTNEKELLVNISDFRQSDTILGDYRLIKACISIITDNAVKYSPQNGNITITATNDSDLISIVIQDEGPGFSEAARSTIFDLFTADNLHYKAHGFGIGLATAKHIMDLMQGKINITNNAIKGASVILKFKKYNNY